MTAVKYVCAIICFGLGVALAFAAVQSMYSSLGLGDNPGVTKGATAMVKAAAPAADSLGPWGASSRQLLSQPRRCLCVHDLTATRTALSTKSTGEARNIH
jgi:hypothetical protein